MSSRKYVTPWHTGPKGTMYKSVTDARGTNNAQEILRHLPWLLVKFGIILYVFVAKRARGPCLLQFFAYTVLIQSFVHTILNCLEGTEGQPVSRERACVAMAIGWPQHRTWTAWGWVCPLDVLKKISGHVNVIWRGKNTKTTNNVFQQYGR